MLQYFCATQTLLMIDRFVVTIRVIKYFNWEHFFTNRVNDMRSQELKYLKECQYVTFTNKSGEVLLGEKKYLTK